MDLRPRCLVLCLVRLRRGFAQILPELALGNRVFEDNNTDVENEGEVVDMEGGGYGAPSRVLGLEVVDMIVNAERREVFHWQKPPSSSNYCFLVYLNYYSTCTMYFS